MRPRPGRSLAPSPASADNRACSGGIELGYAIAAYAIVIGSLLGYGLWVQARRRELMRRMQALEADAALRGAPRGPGARPPA